MRLDAVGAPVAARPRRGNLARGLEALHPAHGAGDAHPKPFGRRIARKPILDDGFHHPRTKITRKRHSRRLLPAAAIMNQRISDSGIPSDSLRSETALKIRCIRLRWRTI